MENRGPKITALAANMRRLMGQRSVQTIRAEMAARGLKIGSGSLQKAIHGEGGNRLETLDKIARFFDTTVDQLLQVDGVEAGFWPFSSELQVKVLALSDEELARLENVMRAHLGLPAHSVDDQQRHTRSDETRTAELGYPHASQAGGVGQRGYPALKDAALPDEEHGSTQDKRSAPSQGGRSGR